MQLANLELSKANIQHVVSRETGEANVLLDVLRLDKIHPVISGNKSFKLQYYLQEAMQKNYAAVATFGGAYSNHLLATAFACKELNLKCIVFIRGEKPQILSPTLQDALQLSMQPVFVSRTDYANKQAMMDAHPDLYFIPEGGYGLLGTKGAAEILKITDNPETYNYVVCAAGTGTMLAGIAVSLLPHQQVIGINVLKNQQLIHDVKKLLPDEHHSKIKVFYDYHFGGYAKWDHALITFMNNINEQYQLPLDFVYTAKAFYAVCDLIKLSYFKAGSRILFIHSGGLQGNRSLPEQTLINS